MVLVGEPVETLHRHPLNLCTGTFEFHQQLAPDSRTHIPANEHFVQHLAGVNGFHHRPDTENHLFLRWPFGVIRAFGFARNVLDFLAILMIEIGIITFLLYHCIVVLSFCSSSGRRKCIGIVYLVLRVRLSPVL